MKTYIPGETKEQRKARKNLSKNKKQPISQQPQVVTSPPKNNKIAFVIGNGDVDTSNGLAGSNPSNAFIVNYDGSATLSGDLTINSDARLKSNIISLGSTLAKLLMIDGKSYTMKTNEAESKIGLLAQEVQKVFPELVKTTNNNNHTLSVNYQGLIPVLINAIKEQQKQIKEFKLLLIESE